MTVGENITEVVCQSLLEKVSSVKTRQLSSVLVFRWRKTAPDTALAFKLNSQVKRSKSNLGH